MQRALNNHNLRQLPASVKVPGYNRENLTAGIVHVGVGGFHRSHEAFYTDDYMSETGDTSWGICGIGLREGDRKLQQRLKQQDYLYSLLIKHPDGQSDVQVIGCLTDFLMGPDDPSAVINKMAAPETRIVSLTITEGGYNFNPATGEFDFANPDVKHDIAHPDSPRLVFGYLAAALKLRKERGHQPFTVQSCDNIQHNGNVTRKMLTSYISAFDEALADWVSVHVSFPNAMVDRITPATTPAVISELRDYGIEDAWPVTCEPFHQWVIEDSFSAGRPGWERCGAQLVDDVTPYETMKIRLLNAGHTVLGVSGSLQGFSTIDETVRAPLFAGFLRLFMDKEATPVLHPVPGIDLEAYKDTLLARFANPNIKDHLSRICSESSSKFATFLVPTIKENLAAGGNVNCAALIVAAWCWYSCYGRDQHGNELDVIDAQASRLQQFAQLSKEEPLVFLRQKEIFGELADNPAFTSLYADYLQRLYSGDTISALMKAVLASAEINH